MTTIRQAIAIAASSNAAYWLRQVNRDLPYGDLDALADAARAEGLAVTQKCGHHFLIANTAWMNAGGTVTPISANNL
jgi:hypothetical protein